MESIGLFVSECFFVCVNQFCHFMVLLFLCFNLVHVVNSYTLVKVSFCLSFCLTEVCVSAVFQPSMSQ